MTDPHTTPTPEIITGLLADTSPYLSCDECFDRIDEYVERRIADPHYDDLAMRVHLAGCGACAEEAATLHDLLEGHAR
ncbi:hypothetical protein [Nocardia cyriacigeorgica]|uniref:Zf-HC2 domain-containing protein n=1 Tax=Nocardia cyriacigeorgica TaxID=135487 RepID=A0A5R8NPI0_9NOCA|nr:hypothetical protein [Nocardia cyriacigeorgica]TLF77596.1 hypothetical protein FEK34_14860 [Nocardia cyriacigeorgica]